MALVKPKLGDDVLKYDENQTEAINGIENNDILKSDDQFMLRGITLDANIGHGTRGNSGWYVCGEGSVNVPNQYGTLIHFDRDTVAKAQIFIQISSGKMYSRARSSSGVWSSWLTAN